MKVICVALIAAAVCAFTEAKGFEGASQGLKTINKLLGLSTVRGLTAVSQRARDDEEVEEGEYELSMLELEMCGEWGLGGAFWEAYAEVDPAHLEGVECLAMDAFIWTLVHRAPFVLCFLTPEERRVGFDCLEEFMSSDADVPEVISELHEYVKFIMGFVEPYLPQPQPECAAEPAQRAAVTEKKAEVTANFERKLMRILEAVNKSK